MENAIHDAEEPNGGARAAASGQVKLPRGGGFPRAANLIAATERSWNWLPAAVVFIAAFADCGPAESLAGTGYVTEKYVTENVERGSIVRLVSATGLISPANATALEARVSGPIQAVYCWNLNMMVKAGQLCAKIDPSSFRARVDHERASFASAETRLEKDKAVLKRDETDIARAQTQANRGAISRAALEKSRGKYERDRLQIIADEASVTERRAALEAAQADLANTDIVSPLDGVVALRNVEAGQIVGSGSPLFLIAADLARVRIDADVSEKDLVEHKNGDKVAFTVSAWPNRSFEGEITQINSSPRPIQEGEITHMVVSAPNPDLVLKPRMEATVNLFVGRRNDVLRVPDKALGYSLAHSVIAGGDAGEKKAANAQSFLWVLRAGKVLAIPVELGLDDGTHREVTKGELRRGDQVIVDEYK